MKHSEQFALNEWLSDYPKDRTYDEICDLIQVYECDSVVPWQWFESMPTHELVQNIDNTRSHFEHTINSMKAEGVFA